LFTELDRSDDFQAGSVLPDCVIGRDDDVDAGGVGLLLTAGYRAVVQGKGEVVVHELGEDGGDLGGVPWGADVSAEGVAHLDMDTVHL